MRNILNVLALALLHRPEANAKVQIRQCISALALNQYISTSGPLTCGLFCSHACHKDFSFISKNPAARKLPNIGRAPIMVAAYHHFATSK
ncbi:hypothetical protein DER44DRAFT_141 [Fusarium oxysporum]|nr:hypothetical protein DER44DRAFT_141 [Fusarium oxysporum]